MRAPEGGVVIAETREAETARSEVRRERGERNMLGKSLSFREVMGVEVKGQSGKTSSAVLMGDWTAVEKLLRSGPPERREPRVRRQNERRRGGIKGV
jgi:hypothetical protein